MEYSGAFIPLSTTRKDYWECRETNMDSSAEESQPLNQPEQGADSEAVRGRAAPASGPVQYSPLPVYVPQGAPIAYQPMPMRPMMQPAASLPAAPSMPRNPVTIWTRMPQTTVCPYCSQNVTTTLVYNHCGSSLPWITCLGLFCSGFCLCCWVPFLCESCKDVMHLCPLCRSLLGRKGMM